MPNPEQEPAKSDVVIKKFEKRTDFPADPKEEGIRPNARYAGGEPNEIIEVAGVRYRKEVACKVHSRDPHRQEQSERPTTEKEYFSHETPDVGPGPGWDGHIGYISEGWPNLRRLEPGQLSDLPLYNLIRIEEE